jgi:hypothetical protein
MTVRIRDTAGFVAGILFLAVGFGAIAVARGYPIGSALHMGPGYFPIVLGVLLIVVGTASVLRSLAVAADSPERITLGPLLTTSAAVIVFAGGIDRLGLIPTVFVTALLASIAAPDWTFREAGSIAACLAVLAAAIFYYGLKLPFALF